MKEEDNMEKLTRTILIELQESDEAFAYNEAVRILQTAYALYAGIAGGTGIADATGEALEAAEVFKKQLHKAGIKVVSSWGEGNEWEVVLDAAFNWSTGASIDYIIAGLAAWEVDGRPSVD